MAPLSLLSSLLTVRHFVRSFELREFPVFFLSVIRTVLLATGGFPVFLIVRLYLLLLLLLKGVPGALSGIILLTVLLIRVSVSKQKDTQIKQLKISALSLSRTQSRTLNSKSHSEGKS